MIAPPPSPHVGAGPALGLRLARLDVLLHREILRLRAAYSLSLDEFRGLYVSDDQVDHLASRAVPPEDGPDVAGLTAEADALGRGAKAGPDSPWRRLVGTLGLGPVEEDVLALALAPEVHRKYETLYAYLHDDVSRKRPSHDLALRLFGDGPSHAVRQSLLAERPLYALGLIRAPTDDGAWRSRAFEASAPAVRAALGLPVWDPALGTVARFDLRPDVSSPLSGERTGTLADVVARDGAPMVALEGPDGVGRRDAAQCIAGALGRDALVVDLAALAAWPEAARALSLVARLRPALLVLYASRAFFRPDAARLPSGLLETLAEAAPLVAVVPERVRWRDRLAHPAVRVALPLPDAAARRAVWEGALGRVNGHARALDGIADRFRLTPRAIRRAAADALATARLHDRAATEADLLRAARGASSHALADLAVKVEARPSWDDLVLPPEAHARVRAVAAAAAHRERVLGAWGFGRHAHGRGLVALLTGPSGTGKTLAASVVAADLGLDLYRVDLSRVVSKYIGETEQNLDRIFDAAAAGNAIVLFDEADALLGKRSEVRDARDRYANIEVAYLLQRIETYDGVVLLASNLPQNLDEAFARRMHIVVAFPRPDAALRLRLWERLIPDAAPLADDLDLGFLARSFPLAGGDIRTVTLDAAFHAAADDAPIAMRHLVRATGCQLAKQGGTAGAEEFGPYAALLHA